MAATYGGKPESSALDAVRLLVGDTDCETAFLQDSEIEYFIDDCGNTNFAAARAAEAIAARLARRYDVSGAITKAQNALMEKFLTLAKSLRARGNESCTVYAGGLSENEKEIDSANADLVQPDFETHMHDNPRAGSQTPDRRDRWGF